MTGGTSPGSAQRRALPWKVLVAILLLVVVVAGILIVDNPFQQKPPSILVFSADAYVAESSALESGFVNSTGAAYVAPTAAGSFVLAQQIRGGAPASVFISVSRSALTSAYLGNRAPGWAVAFAGDQMVLAYAGGTPSTAVSAVLAAGSAASSSNTTRAWYDFFANLTSGSVKVGIANPNADPAGYRGWIVLEAAGLTYASNSTYFANRMTFNNANVTGASAANLVAPLQTGNIDFLFIYKSAAISHNLNYVSLEKQINLGDAKLGQYYSKFSYTTTGGVQKGAAIVLFVTVPLNATQTQTALDFVVYVVQHAQSMASYGLSVFSPPTLYNSTAVPSTISQLADSGAVKLGGTL